MIVGLDTASNRFHAVLSGSDYSYCYCKAIQKNPDERRLELYREALNFFGSLEPGSHVFCEEPLALQNGKTTRLLGLAAGAIWAAHVDFDIWWHWVDVAHWKKEIIGKGNAKKEDIAAWCLANPAFKHQEIHQELLDKEPDFYDAYCLKVYGVRFVATAKGEASGD